MCSSEQFQGLSQERPLRGRLLGLKDLPGTILAVLSGRRSTTMQRIDLCRKWVEGEVVEEDVDEVGVVVGEEEVEVFRETDPEDILFSMNLY